VRSRSVLMGLGTAAILAAGAAPPAFATTTTPSPTAQKSVAPSVTPMTTTNPSTTPATSSPPAALATKPPHPPKQPVLHVTTSVPAGALHGGDSVIVTIDVWSTNATAYNAILLLSTTSKITTDRTCTATTKVPCTVGILDLSQVKAHKHFPVKVTIPKKMKTGTPQLIVTVTANTAPSASSAQVNSMPVSRTLTVTAVVPPAAIAKLPAATPAATSTPTYTAPTPTGSLQPAAPGQSLTLPQVLAPSTAPTASLAGNATALRSGSPSNADVVFKQLAGTTAGWLAALLVAFAVLLTQVRLRILRYRPDVTRAPRAAHRRPSGGLFKS
jgi:hypothetical protein